MTDLSANARKAGTEFGKSNLNMSDGEIRGNCPHVDFLLAESWKRAALFAAEISRMKAAGTWRAHLHSSI